MASGQDRRNLHRRTISHEEGLSQHGLEDTDSQSAYWATTHSNSSEQHLAVPITSPNSGRFRAKKPTSLRNLMRRKTEGESRDLPTSSSQSSHFPPDTPEPLRSAPPTVTTYDHPPRAHSQPPESHRSISASSLSGPFNEHDPEMFSQSDQSHDNWNQAWNLRPASTYPQMHWDQRPHSYYSDQPSSSYTSHLPNAQSQYLAYRPRQQGQVQPQTQPQLQLPQHTTPPSQRGNMDDDFDDPTEVGLFAEALSGFSGVSTPFSVQSPTSPQAQASALPGSRPPYSIQTSSLQPGPWNLPQPTSSTSYTSNSSFNDYRSPNHVMNHAIMSIQGDEEERPPDDELPNYAQSQAEEAAKRRHEAASRAAELEQRWAASQRY